MSSRPFNWSENIRIRTGIPVASRNIDWTIVNYRYCVKQIGEKIESSVFFAGHEKTGKWKLEIYPSGYDFKCAGYVSFYLKSLNDSPIGAKYSVSILNQNQEKCCSFFDQSVFPSNGRLGTRTLIRSEKLFMEKNALLPNGCLTISCSLNIPGPETNHTITYYHSRLEHQNRLNKDFMKLFRSSELCDITISVGNETFRAHRAILAARSSVFSAMFRHNMKESLTNVISIDDIDPYVMEQILLYIYSGKSQIIKEMASDLLPAADKYNLVDLKAECEEILCSQLTSDNALPYYMLAEMHNLNSLKSQATHFLGPIISYLNSDTYDVIKNRNNSIWKSFSKKYLHKGLFILGSFLGLITFKNTYFTVVSYVGFITIRDISCAIFSFYYR